MPNWRLGSKRHSGNHADSSRSHNGRSGCQKCSADTALVIFLIILPILLCALPFFFKASDPKWADQIKTPAYTPNRTLSALIWGLLAAVVGCASIAVVKVKGLCPTKTAAMILYFIQLFGSAIMPWIFFYAHRLLLTVIISGITLCVILFTLVLFGSIRWWAGLAMAIWGVWHVYNLWVFAAIAGLNDAVGEGDLNRSFRLRG